MTTQNIEVVSGDAVVLEITILDQTTGDPVNLAGCTAIFKAAQYWSKAAVFTKSTADDVSMVDPINGRIDVSLEAADTDALEGEYAYELQITDSAGNRSTPLYGVMAVTGDLITT
mgnify:CR=1 FL=1